MRLVWGIFYNACYFINSLFALKTKPFFLMCQHKAPHRTFAPALRHLGAFDEVEIPEPDSLFDDYANRSQTLAKNEMEIDDKKEEKLEWINNVHHFSYTRYYGSNFA